MGTGRFHFMARETWKPTQTFSSAAFERHVPDMVHTLSIGSPKACTFAKRISRLLDHQ